MDEVKRVVKILGMAGSLRRGSFNKAALRAAGELLPYDAWLETADLALLPFFNEDLEGEALPQPITELAAKVKEADARFCW